MIGQIVPREIVPVRDAGLATITFILRFTLARTVEVASCLEPKCVGKNERPPFEGRPLLQTKGREKNFFLRNWNGVGDALQTPSPQSPVQGRATDWPFPVPQSASSGK